MIVPKENNFDPLAALIEEDVKDQTGLTEEQIVEALKEGEKERDAIEAIARQRKGI